MKKAIVLLSGGQDSTTCLFWAKEKFDEVIAIGFDYGQRHKLELEQAQKIADMANIVFYIKKIDGVLGGSSLTDHSLSLNASHDKLKELPSSFTAGRNALFLTMATSFGFSFDCHDIVTGTCQTDYSGYPDCRRVFIDAQQTALSLALDTDIRIHTPLMYLTKAETWKMAADLQCIDMVRDYSLTDYGGSTKVNPWGMGELDNPASELRAKGYYEALENGWINV